MTGRRGPASGLNLHVYPSDMRFEGRILRITQYLQTTRLFSGIELVGINNGTNPAEETLPDGRRIRRFAVLENVRKFSRLARLLDFLLWYGRVARYYLRRDVRCINAHSISVLPLCYVLSRLKNCALVYEPHELETETANKNKRVKPLLRAMEKFLSRRADSVITVDEWISEWYVSNYGLKRVRTVRNIPAQQQIEPLPQGYYASKFGFDSKDLVFLYQGIIAPGRGIEPLVTAFRQVPANLHLVILGFGPLSEWVREQADTASNIHYHDAVANRELLRYSHAADVGVLMIENVSLSYVYCYPNKYCEYISAGIPVIYSEFLKLREEVERYDAGWAAPMDAVRLAALVRGIGPGEIEEKKTGARRWALENKWSNEVKILNSVYSADCGLPDMV